MPIDEHPVATPGAVSALTLAETTINPSDGGVNMHMAGGVDAPAAAIVPLSLGGADITPVPTFRALRFDGPGVFKFDITGGATGQTRTVGAGEVWPINSTAFSKIYSAANGTTATNIDAWT